MGPVGGQNRESVARHHNAISAIDVRYRKSVELIGSSGYLELACAAHAVASCPTCGRGVSGRDSDNGSGARHHNAIFAIDVRNKSSVDLKKGISTTEVACTAHAVTSHQIHGRGMGGSDSHRASMSPLRSKKWPPPSSYMCMMSIPRPFRILVTVFSHRSNGRLAGGSEDIIVDRAVCRWTYQLRCRQKRW